MLNESLARYIHDMTARTSAETIRTMRHRVSQWMQRMGDADVSQQAVEDFRDKATTEGLSPATVEAIVYAVRRIVNHCGEQVVTTGRKLYVPRPSPDVPTVERIDAIYRKVSVAKWPRRLNLHNRCEWWRAYIVLSCWTAFRIGDVRALTWSNIGADAVRVQAIKTRRYNRPDIAVPISLTLRRHLGAIKGLYGDRVFGLTTCLRQHRNELERIADAAGVPYVCPHGFRRFSINQWAAADSLAGQIIQGQRLGSMSHYLDCQRHLAKAASNVVMPDCFYTAAELARKHNDEAALVDAYRAAKADEKRLILDLARRLA